MSGRHEAIERLAAKLDGLRGNATYWDLRRTYGDDSPQVLAHLRSCAEVQRRDGNHT